MNAARERKIAAARARLAQEVAVLVERHQRENKDQVTLLQVSTGCRYEMGKLVSAGVAVRVS